MSDEAPISASIKAQVHRAELYETLGVEIVSASDGVAVLEIASGVGLRNSKGDLHGGAVLALADIAVSCAARSLLDERDSLSTVSVTTNFVRPAKLPVRAVARVVTLGGRISSAQVDISSNGEVVAHGVATIRVFRAPPPADDPSA